MKNIPIYERSLITMPISMNITKGLSDIHRVKILDILYHKELSIKELMIYLKKMKLNVAPTTLRHHINILKKNGLIEISKTSEVKGTVVKYYKSNLKPLFFENFPLTSLTTDYAELINSLYPKFYKIIKEFILSEKNFNSNLSPQLKTKCRICKTYHYFEFLLFLILNVIITRISRKLLKVKI